MNQVDRFSVSLCGPGLRISTCARTFCIHASCSFNRATSASFAFRFSTFLSKAHVVDQTGLAEKHGQ
jgi:hypothetical protein